MKPELRAERERLAAEANRKYRDEQIFRERLSKARLHTTLEDGLVFIGSDSHYRPNIVSTAHRAFVHLAKEMRPRIIVKNGDELDFPRISRHPPIGWESLPSVAEEIEFAKERLQEIIDAVPGASRYWPLGNHDARFSTRLAEQAPQYAKVHGVQLSDHFPQWNNCWAVWINNDVVVKHRGKNGIHATYNNVKDSGKTIITGHLHALKVAPFSDYNGVRYGVDCGTLADIYGDQFVDYTEDSPKSWGSGFVILKFVKGQLLQPRIVRVVDERAGTVDCWGDKIITV